LTLWSIRCRTKRRGSPVRQSPPLRQACAEYSSRYSSPSVVLALKPNHWNRINAILHPGPKVLLAHRPHGNFPRSGCSPRRSAPRFRRTIEVKSRQWNPTRLARVVTTSAMVNSSTMPERFDSLKSVCEAGGPIINLLATAGARMRRTPARTDVRSRSHAAHRSPSIARDCTLRPSGHRPRSRLRALGDRVHLPMMVCGTPPAGFRGWNYGTPGRSFTCRSERS
jgi:hypothetical protein